MEPLVSGPMQLDGNTEENINMKASLIALMFGFFLAVGLPLAATAGPTPGGADSDGDTVEDAFDNCTAVGNAGQEDADHDGCGDICDSNLQCDCNADGIVGTPDFVIMSQQWGLTGVLSCDCNSDLIVGTPDFVIMSQEWGLQTGPSGITNPSRDYAECP